jgi:hypothetical protein
MLKTMPEMFMVSVFFMVSIVKLGYLVFVFLLMLLFPVVDLKNCSDQIVPNICKLTEKRLASFG